MAAAKRDKDDVKYGDGMPSEHCGICEYYIGKQAVGLCQKVKGMIRIEKWCKLFAIEKDRVNS